MPYANLHRHDHYSTGDGADFPQRAVRHAKSLGQKSLGITNHGNVSGLLVHQQACRDVGLHDVLGVEAYYQPTFTLPPDSPKKQNDAQEYKQYHLSILIKNMTGYKNLMMLLTEANKKNFYKHAIVTDSLLYKYGEGLIVLSGCISGYVAQHILLDDIEAAYNNITMFAKLFGHDFYLEVMPHNTPGQDSVNRQLEVWSDLYDLPIVMTEDAHFTKKDEYTSYRVFQRAKHIDVDKSIVDYSRLYMHSEEEMLEAWAALMGSAGYGQLYLNQSARIADMCDVQFDSAVHMPHIAGIDNQRDVLIRAVRNGAKRLGKS